MPTPDVNIEAEYDKYFTSGLYEERYPLPNPSTLQLLADLVKEFGPRLLDFGCGTGRYAAPLLERTNASILGYDISGVAIERLSARCTSHVAQGRLSLLHGDLAALRDTARRMPRFDLVAMNFGVLGHVPSGAARLETLKVVRAALRPGGRLVVSVPNAVRRFKGAQRRARRLIEQGRLEPGDILYQRSSTHGAIELYYHLYRPGELDAELAAAGFRVRDRRCECLLPEKEVVHSSLLARLDRMLAKLLPVSLAHATLTVAEPSAPSARTERVAVLAEAAQPRHYAPDR